MNLGRRLAFAAFLALFAGLANGAVDFSHAAVTDMRPGLLMPVTPLEVEGSTPFIWYAAKPGKYYFWGDADGDGAGQYEVEVKEAGFYRFKNPGMRFRLALSSAPTALWFGDGPVNYRVLEPDAKVWYAPPNWHVHLDEIPAAEAERYVRATGCAFLNPERFWHVAPFAAPAAKLKPQKKSPYAPKIDKVIAATAFAKPKQSRRIVLFNSAYGYRHSKAHDAAPEAFGKGCEKIGYKLDVVTNLQLLADAKFLGQYDAIVLNSTTSLEEEKVPGIGKAMTGYVSGGKGLVLLHAAVDAFYGSKEIQEMNGSLFFGHPWSAPGNWSFVNERPDSPLNAPFAKKPTLMKYSDEIYQFSTPPFDRSKCEVLISMDLSDTMTAAAVERWKSTPHGKDKWRADNDHVVSYTKDYGKGRVFYTSFGHDDRAFCDERLAHMLLGLQYAVGDLDNPPRKRHPEFVDKLWMWGHEPKCWERLAEPLERIGIDPQGHCGQAAACKLMGIKRDCVIRWMALPEPPFDDFIKQFADLDEVAWSLTDGDYSRTFNEKLDMVLDMKKKMPNLTTVYLDDYFQAGHERPHAELAAARDRLHAAGLKLAVVMYLDVEGFRDRDMKSLDICDSVSVWIWNPSAIATMEDKIRAARKRLGKKPLLLGLYMWSFGCEGFGPVGAEKMKAQLAVARRLIDEGAVDGFIFHPTISADMDVPAVNMSKDWIKEL